MQPQSQFTGATVIPSVTPELEIKKVSVPSSSETAVPDGQNSNTVPASVRLRMDVQEEPDSVEQSKKSRIRSKKVDADFNELIREFLHIISLGEKKPVFLPLELRNALETLARLSGVPNPLYPSISQPSIPQSMKPKSPTRKSNLGAGYRNGRPALPEEERQTYVRHTRYNEAENALLLANVKRSGMKNVSEYIRSVTLNPHIVPRLNESEMRVARNLSGMSNNFNQLLRLCYQRGLDAMTRDVQFYLNQFRELFSKLNS